MFRNLLLNPFLSLSEKVYKIGLNLSQSYYRKTPYAISHVHAHVISVGNITWGGTGKTPLVIMLAKIISARGKRVAVLTRGYGKDETYELKNSLSGVPILVGRDRVKKAREAIKKFNAEVLILDDGFQHVRLKRNCDIVAINATDPFGNECLIPRGNLREPLSHLVRADAFVLTKATLGNHNLNLIKQKIKNVNPNAPIFEADHRPIRFMDYQNNKPVKLETVRSKKIGVLCGIEDPISFENILSRLGAKICFAARFNDHHPFTKKEIKEVLRACREEHADYLITTAKDYYRLSRVLKKEDVYNMPVLVLQIGIRMEDQPNFVRKCLSSI